MNRYTEKMGGLQKHDCGEWIDYDDHLEALRKCRDSVIAEVREAWVRVCKEHPDDGVSATNLGRYVYPARMEALFQAIDKMEETK